MLHFTLFCNFFSQISSKDWKNLTGKTRGLPVVLTSDLKKGKLSLLPN
jgi:hypothetical protein